jgi:hypothetical protein
MSQTGGIDVLVAWLLFGGLLSLLVYYLLRPFTDVMTEAQRSTADTDGNDPSYPPSSSVKDRA